MRYLPPSLGKEKNNFRNVPLPQSVLPEEARKLIKVPESFMFSHEKFIALFCGPLQVRKTAKIKGCLIFLG